MEYLKKRVTEPSTWLGILTAVAGTIGFSTNDPHIAELATGLASLFGIVMAGTPDKGN